LAWLGRMVRRVVGPVLVRMELGQLVPVLLELALA